jgi:putative heme degradation protein
MQNDSLETLLLRHYGSAAQTPVALEEKLSASVRQEVAKLNEQERVAAYLRERRISRRKAIRLVAMGTAGQSA